MEPLSSDDELFAELSAALAEADLPQAVRDSGRSAWIWRAVDQELATLVYDSALDPKLAALSRSSAVARTLVFRIRATSLELELSGGEVAGQVVPARPGHVETIRPDGGLHRESIDDLGRFLLDEVPTGPVRLRCRTAGGAELTTGWIRVAD